ncbi:STE3-domain-containing protein [Dichomitus squalens]|uniref:STE3-domain-containing protein n=1 Tax=Dichomitus squalens TaxID=114155 RepID=A0A4Q9MRM5_9APHY|nr:STE3-domain-containing protein [Dichomitus squalens]
MAPYWIAQVDAPAALSLLGFVLITIPLLWQLKSWNIGCILYIFWIGGVCLANGINMLLWRTNAINFAPVWCDIYIRFYIASGIGVVSSTLVITHRLYHIANMSAISLTRAQRRRNTIIDLFIGLGIPLLAVAVFWFYQGHRFNIYEGVGCMEAYPNTFLSILLNTSWPLPIGLTSAVFAVLALRAAFDRTRDLRRLTLVEPGLTTSRYYRLMALAFADLLCTIPLTIYMIVINTRANAMYTYVGLADLHSGFGRVDSIAAIVWRADQAGVAVVMFRIWTPIACAFLFFLMFGFTEEALEHYMLAISWVADRFGCARFRRRRAPRTMRVLPRDGRASGLSHYQIEDWEAKAGRIPGEEMAGLPVLPSKANPQNALPQFLRESLPPMYGDVPQRPPSVHLPLEKQRTLYILHPTAGLNSMDISHL